MILSFVLGLFALPLEYVYWLKWLIAYIAIRVHNAFHARRFDLYDIDAKDDPVKLGFLIPPLETDLESPLGEHHLREAADEIAFYGVNSRAEHVLLRVARGADGVAESWVHLRLQDGRTFQLAESARFQENAADFSCGRLHMRFLLPMRCWRIHFCGMLKETTGNINSSNDPVFVKFVFIWKASSDVYDLDLHTDPCGIASAMARTTWKKLFVPPIHEFVAALNFYAQSGVISGTVSIDEADDYEMYLFGEKMRNIGKTSKLAGCKFTSVVGKTLANGFTFHVEKFTVPNLINKYTSGFIVRPDTIMENTKDSNVTRSAEDSTQPIHVEFTTTSRKSTYELEGKPVGDPIILYSDHGWSGFLELTFIEFVLGDKKGFGFIMEGECYEEVKTLPKNHLNRIVYPTVVPLTVKFAEDPAQFEEISGGKGASLAKLTKFSSIDRSFTVPKGIVVTTEAYKEFLTSEILSAVKELEDVTYGNARGDVKQSCVIVSEIVIKSSLPDKVCHSIIRDLKSTFGAELNHLQFAVRSSATGEDTEAMSAAGQMDTFLGVQGLKNIFTAVKKCWASQFGHIAVEYKRRNGQPLNCPMAVVVQEMVACDVAGVIFTCDPVTGNPSKISISANYGLGETVVSGSVEPDSIVLKKATEDRVQMDSVMIGGKHQKIILQESGGVMTEDLDEDSKTESCITPEKAEELGRLGIRVEKYYKSPRDIEWGMVGEKIYLLQSRPVTSMTGESEYEIVHEFDTALRYENEYFTMANVGEVMPGSMTPLGTSFVFKNFGNCTKKMVARKGGVDNMFQSKYFSSGCIQFCNHVMIGVAEIITRFGFGTITSKGFMVSVFGRVIDDPELLAVVQDIFPNDVPPRNFFQQLYFIWDMLSYHSGCESTKKALYEIDTSHTECKTSEDLFMTLLKEWSLYEEVFERHFNASENSSNWNIYLFEILCKANNGEFDIDVYSDFSRLLASSSDVESADVPQSMQKLSEQIEKDFDSDTFKEMNAEEAQEWLRTSATKSSLLFKEFLKRHGHRCLMEFDVRSETWEMNPKPLIELLQNLCGAAKPVEKEGHNDDQLISELNVNLGFISRNLLRFVLPNCRSGVRTREFTKSMCIKAVDNFRKGCHQLASLMVSEGRIPDPDLIYFFGVEELQDLLQSRSPSLISRAFHRRKVFAETMDLKFPEITRGIPKPINLYEDETDYETVADLTMKGTPVSHGVTKGYARVALNIKEAALLQPGEILIAYSTDIGWSPYFPIIAGVVTELGGLISHGAVVSREYGLPCVVGLHGATKKFKTGDYVLIDGKKGILQRLSLPSE